MIFEYTHKFIKILTNHKPSNDENNRILRWVYELSEDFEKFREVLDGLCEYRVEVDGERWDFERLWRKCERNILHVHPEHIACICAEYLVSRILRREFGDEEQDLLKYVELNYRVRPLFYGVSWILGYKLKRFEDVIEILKDFDLSLAGLIVRLFSDCLVVLLYLSRLYDLVLVREKNFDECKDTLDDFKDALIISDLLKDHLLILMMNLVDSKTELDTVDVVNLIKQADKIIFEYRHKQDSMMVITPSK